jgi:midasin (ATPase involved in ribosome maturation)
LANYINKNFLVANSKFGKYIIIEDDNNIKYYRNLKECARENSLSRSTLMKHSNASKDSPYFIKNKCLKFYYSNEYIDVKYAAVPIEKSLELLSGNIGEGCDANPEISIDSNESIPS